MPVTTEPPWLNKSTAVAPRNGTNTHVVTFSTDGDAPFTPTNGSLLVFICFGAVTHTVSAGGWTERLSPVSSAELSVFEVVASSHTSISVLHNGSNYLMPWLIYELPAGTVWTDGASSLITNDVFPALPGLPGTEQLVFAALGRSLTTSGSSTTGSATWSAPWVEDLEVNTANVAGNEGNHLTIAHQINVTATSITPTNVQSWLIDGAWSGDREKITFAYDAVAPSGGTPFTKDYTIAWQVRNSITKDYTVSWTIRNLITKDYSVAWQVRNLVTKDYALAWQVLNSFNKDYTLVWSIRNSFTKDYQVLWDITTSTSFVKDYQVLWNIRNSFTKDYTVSWRVLAVGAVTFYLWRGGVETLLTVDGVWNGATIVPYDTIEVT